MGRLKKVPIDIDDPAFHAIFASCGPFAMGQAPAMYGLFKAIGYIVHARIPGDIAECGVWRGGSSMAIAMSLIHFGDTSRTLHLYDTFDGTWGAPSQADTMVSPRGATHADITAFYKRRLTVRPSHHTSMESVRKRMRSTGYPARRINLVKGLVEHTLPARAPKDLALIRLDTDFFRSTFHELTHLYPRLKKRGVLFIDDYGHYLGARRATDRYFKQHGVTVLLQRLDANERIAIKL